MSDLLARVSEAVDALEDATTLDLSPEEADQLKASYEALREGSITSPLERMRIALLLYRRLVIPTMMKQELSRLRVVESLVRVSEAGAPPQRPAAAPAAPPRPGASPRPGKPARGLPGRPDEAGRAPAAPPRRRAGGLRRIGRESP
jgi:hypothetical protein